MPKTGRLLIGMLAGFESEWWPVFDRKGGRLDVGSRKLRSWSVIERRVAMVSGTFWMSSWR